MHMLIFLLFLNWRSLPFTLPANLSLHFIAFFRLFRLAHEILKLRPEGLDRTELVSDLIWSAKPSNKAALFSYDGTHRDNALQIPIQPIDVLKYLLHALQKKNQSPQVPNIQIISSGITYHRNLPNQFLTLLLEDSWCRRTPTRARRWRRPSHFRTSLISYSTNVFRFAISFRRDCRSIIVLRSTRRACVLLGFRETRVVRAGVVAGVAGPKSSIRLRRMISCPGTAEVALLNAHCCCEPGTKQSRIGDRGEVVVGGAELIRASDWQSVRSGGHTLRSFEGCVRTSICILWYLRLFSWETIKYCFITQLACRCNRGTRPAASWPSWARYRKPFWQEEKPHKTVLGLLCTLYNNSE